MEIDVTRIIFPEDTYLYVLNFCEILKKIT